MRMAAGWESQELLSYLIPGKEKPSENMNSVMSTNTSGLSEVKISIDESLLGEMILKSEDKEDPKEDPGAAELTALGSNVHELEECDKNLRSSCDTLAFVKTAKDWEFESLRMQLDDLCGISKSIEKAEEEAMARGRQEQTNTEKQLSAKEEKLNSTTAEIEECKTRIHQLQEELQQEERSFACQVSAQYRKSLDSWHRANALEQELVHLDREAEHLRLEMMKLAEGYKRQGPALGGPGWENQAWRDAGALACPGRRSGPVLDKHAQNAQVHTESRGHLPGWGMPSMPYSHYRGGPFKPFMGCELPSPFWGPLYPAFGPLL
nr:uncharacterized protein LOC103348559 isoform X2 [Oryctolagus cuniculus]